MQIDGDVKNKANTNAVGIDNAPHQRQQEAKAWGGVWWGAGKPSIGQVWTCHFAPAMAACPQPSSLSQFHLCSFLCLYQHCSLSISLSSLNAVKLNSGLGSGLFCLGYAPTRPNWSWHTCHVSWSRSFSLGVHLLMAGHTWPCMFFFAQPRSSMGV